MCYDTHTKCEVCRGQVCSLDSFCNECEGWSAEFRKLYLRHKHSLFAKRVSKKNRKEGKSKDKSPLNVDAPPPRVDDTPPPSFDDAASTASQESHVTSPVVMMPLNQDLIDANLTVEQLQTFQHVDNVVEVQLQPCPVPPQSTTVVDTSFFERVNNMMNTFDNLIPLLTKLGSDRRSPTAGPSESVSPNPLARVPDSAPQSLGPRTFIGLFGASCFHFRPPAATPGRFRLPTWSVRREGQVQRKSPCLSFASTSLEATD